MEELLAKIESACWLAELANNGVNVVLKPEELRRVLSYVTELEHLLGIKKHDFELVWLTCDLEGFRCKGCGYETLDPEGDG